MRTLLLTYFVVSCWCCVFSAPCFAQTERQWQEAIAAHWQSGQDVQEEVRLEDGTRVDLLTDSHAIEIDFDRKVYEGIGQALYYGEMTHKRSGLLLIPTRGQNINSKYRDRFNRATRRVAIDLWEVRINPARTRATIYRWQGPVGVPWGTAFDVPEDD